MPFIRRGHHGDRGNHFRCCVWRHQDVAIGKLASKHRRRPSLDMFRIEHILAGQKRGMEIVLELAMQLVLVGHLAAWVEWHAAAGIDWNCRRDVTC